MREWRGVIVVNRAIRNISNKMHVLNKIVKIKISYFAYTSIYPSFIFDSVVTWDNFYMKNLQQNKFTRIAVV